jgi:phosphopantothenoylcysteine decarboxylase/phosphopantothenate--cysteine ligase
MLSGKRILLIIAGSIAAYKALDLIRRIKERQGTVRCILTEAAACFVTPLAVASLSGDKVYTDLFSLTDEIEIGHIQLSRAADLVVAAPATADLLAKMAMGLASDLATTVLLATDKPVLVAPAMNIRMWNHPATQTNLSLLIQRGVSIVGPCSGSMACGEHGLGRMAESLEILSEIETKLSSAEPSIFSGLSLTGRRAIVTSGPTYELIDPVRYIANRSSGKQGHAIASALAELGCTTILVTGPTHEPDPAGVIVIRTTTACEMLAACQSALPADIAICAAAVADWRVANTSPQKLKKDSVDRPVLVLTENPDILSTLSVQCNVRPRLVVGFAAETERVVEQACAKRLRKGCDWILANDVSTESGTFGGDINTVHLIQSDSVENWPPMTKVAIGRRLASAIARCFALHGW